MRNSEPVNYPVPWHCCSLALLHARNPFALCKHYAGDFSQLALHLSFFHWVRSLQNIQVAFVDHQSIKFIEEASIPSFLIKTQSHPVILGVERYALSAIWSLELSLSNKLCNFPCIEQTNQHNIFVTAYSLYHRFQHSDLHDCLEPPKSQSGPKYFIYYELYSALYRDFCERGLS